MAYDLEAIKQIPIKNVAQDLGIDVNGRNGTTEERR